MLKTLLLTAIPICFMLMNSIAQDTTTVKTTRLSTEFVKNETKMGIKIATAPLGAVKGGGFNLLMEGSSTPRLKGTMSVGLFATETTRKTKFGGNSYDYDIYCPVKFGLKYFIGNRFYGSAELGAVFDDGDKFEVKLICTPGIGIELPVSKRTVFDMGFHYENWFFGEQKSFIAFSCGFLIGRKVRS